MIGFDSAHQLLSVGSLSVACVCVLLSAPTKLFNHRSLFPCEQFWSGLSSSARRELLRIDKQALFEQVRKNLYCSRCHGLLVEGYAQIVSYGKNLQAGLLGYGNGSGACNTQVSDGGSSGENSNLQDDTRDPSVHPWGGLAATRDSMLTVLDCFLDGTPLEVLQNIPTGFLECFFSNFDTFFSLFKIKELCESFLGICQCKLIRVG